MYNPPRMIGKIYGNQEQLRRAVLHTTWGQRAKAAALALFLYLPIHLLLCLLMPCRFFGKWAPIGHLALIAAGCGLWLWGAPGQWRMVALAWVVMGLTAFLLAGLLMLANAVSKHFIHRGHVPADAEAADAPPAVTCPQELPLEWVEAACGGAYLAAAVVQAAQRGVYVFALDREGDGYLDPQPRSAAIARVERADSPRPDCERWLLACPLEPGRHTLALYWQSGSMPAATLTQLNLLFPEKP